MCTDVDEVQAAIPEDLPQDLELAKLPLSVRALNSLARAGIHYGGQLRGKTIEDLLELKSMGQKTALEVMNLLSNLSDYEKILEKQEAEEAQTSAPDSAPRLPEDLPADLELKTLPLPVRALNSFAHEGIQFAADLGGKSLRDLLNMKNMGKKTAQTVFSLLSDLPSRQEEPSEVQKKKAGPIGILEFVANLPEGRNRDMLLQRLNGRTLEDIGTENDLTRERVRQLIEKQLHRRPSLREDRYLPLYQTYDISKEDFALAFGEPIETYMYLESICKSSARKQKAVDQDMLADESIEPELRKAAERVVYKNHVTIEGFRVPKHRNSLVDFIVKRYCKNITQFSDFLDLYHAILSELNLEDDPSLALDPRTYQNKLSLSREVLWNQWQRFRYYPIDTRDYGQLLSTLDLEQYMDTEISSLKLFRDYPELMRQYDIRDEYELHNLLKKVWPQEGIQPNFKRMPTIEVGTVDKYEQALSLLREYAPISRPDLAQKYEDAYGVKVNSVLANYLDPFDLYLHDGIYSITSKSLPMGQFQWMQQVLTEDFYTIADMKRLYLREFPQADPELMSPYAMKTLDFQVFPGCSGYVIRNTYPNAAAYFRYLLTKADIVDGREIPMSIWRIVSFTQELRERCADYEIVEFLPKQYINIRRLEQSGITKDHLRAYCQAVAEAVEPGGYFTIQSLHQDGFSHELEELGFEDWFYTSLVCADHDRFAFQRVGNTRLLCRGAEVPQIQNLISQIVEREQKMEVYDLQELLERRYGIVFSTDALRVFIRGSDLYYDAIMDAVYDTYDTYWEEI